MGEFLGSRKSANGRLGTSGSVPRTRVVFRQSLNHAGFFVRSCEELYYYREKDRSEKDAKKCYSDHSAEHGGPKRLSHLRTGTNSANQWKYAKSEGERSHQNRAQPQSGSFDSCFMPVSPLIHLLFGKFDDQDRVLTRQADQNHKSNLGKNIVVRPSNKHTADCGKETHRND